MKTKHPLSTLLLSGLLVSLFPAPLLAQMERQPDDNLFNQPQFICTNVSPQAAQQEAYLVGAIEQARYEVESRRSTDTMSLGELVGVVESILPGNVRDRVNLGELTSIVEQGMRRFSKNGQGMGLNIDRGAATQLLAVVGSRIGSLLGGTGGNVNPRQILETLLDTADEVSSIENLFPSENNERLEKLTQELETLQNQCRRGQLSSNYPSNTNYPTATNTSNAFIVGCQQRGGSANTYLEGLPENNSSPLEYHQVIECIPGREALNDNALQGECEASGGLLVKPRSNPVCRL